MRYLCADCGQPVKRSSPDGNRCRKCAAKRGVYRPPTVGEILAERRSMMVESVNCSPAQQYQGDTVGTEMITRSTVSP